MSNLAVVAHRSTTAGPVGVADIAPGLTDQEMVERAIRTLTSDGYDMLPVEWVDSDNLLLPRDNAGTFKIGIYAGTTWTLEKIAAVAIDQRPVFHHRFEKAIRPIPSLVVIGTLGWAFYQLIGLSPHTAPHRVTLYIILSGAGPVLAGIAACAALSHVADRIRARKIRSLVARLMDGELR
jgi:hypothetical protein